MQTLEQIADETIASRETCVRGPRPWRWGFFRLLPKGASHLVPYAGVEPVRLQNRLCRMKNYYEENGALFRTHVEADGIRVERIA